MSEKDYSIRPLWLVTTAKFKGEVEIVRVSNASRPTTLIKLPDGRVAHLGRFEIDLLPECSSSVKLRSAWCKLTGVLPAELNAARKQHAADVGREHTADEIADLERLANKLGYTISKDGE